MAHPLADRYASTEMRDVFSPRRKYSTWRKLWVYLAEAERELGLDISDAQLREMRAHQEITDEEMVRALEYERGTEKVKGTKHDVMAHIRVYGEICPTAKPIIHLGATSMYVGDNTDLIQMRDGLGLVRDKAVCCIHKAAEQAEQYRHVPCLGYSHLQPAQPVTVGKRIAGWAYDMYLAFEDVDWRLAGLRFRGVKGTTGTQASFMKLLGDATRVNALDRKVAEKAGFHDRFVLTGQTYPRVVDYQVLSALGSIAAAAKKAGGDIRLLQMLGEMEEPFEEGQVGSSAMAFKRNPNRTERMCAIARYLIHEPPIMAATAGEQLFERTLDDSATRRIVLPDSFYAADAILNLYNFVVDELVVYPKVIQRHLEEQLPFMATENVIMEAVGRGADRQVCHERVREHSMAVAQMVRDGRSNDLVKRLAGDEYLSGFLSPEDIERIALSTDEFIGRAPEQVETFIAEVVSPLRRKYPNALDIDSGIHI